MNLNPLPEAAPPEFRDRTGALIVAGVLQLLLGTLCVLMVPLMFAGQVMSARLNAGQPQYRMVVPAAVVYAGLAAIFITLGAGSVKGRRWARALSLVLGWSWLVIGVLGMLVYAVVLPRLFTSTAPGLENLPASARSIMIVAAFALLGLFFVLLPALMVLFYRSRHVKSTCETRDPLSRWTDRCPLPVLGLSVWLFLGGLSLLLMPAAYRGVAPFFGLLLSGLPGLIFYSGAAGVFLYCAQACYRLNLKGWWLTLGMVLVLTVSNLITFARVDVIEMYRLMGYPETQIQQLQQFNFLEQHTVLWCSALGFAPLCAYLLFVKKFFPRSASPG